MTKIYPLKLEPQLKEKVWGGNWLVEQLGRIGGKDAPLGESWEAFSGSLITNGEWQGQTLGSLYQAHRDEIGGEVANTYPEFPLLVKFIDARENLSVQVHPDDALAQKLENYRFGKSEMWYIVAAEPQARILYSLNDKATSVEELGQALKNETLLDYINSVPVKTGDVVYLPSRTIHALCEGIVVYELQQESDITYRLYDWGRQGREIHHEKGLQAISLESRNLQVMHPQAENHEDFAFTELVSCPYFSCELLEVFDQVEVEGDSFTLLTALSGSGKISSPTGEFEVENIGSGDTFLLPSSLSYLLQTTDSNQSLRVITAQAN